MLLSCLPKKRRFWNDIACSYACYKRATGQHILSKCELCPQRRVKLLNRLRLMMARVHLVCVCEAVCVNRWTV
jgi:hypothetical protein